MKQRVNIDGILDLGTGEKWLVLRYILKMKSKGFADYLHVEYERKREARENLKGLGEGLILEWKGVESVIWY